MVGYIGPGGPAAQKLRPLESLSGATLSLFIRYVVDSKYNTIFQQKENTLFYQGVI